MRHAHVLLPSLLDADSAASRDRLHLALAALLRARREAAPAVPLGAGEALALPSKRYNMVSRWVRRRAHAPKTYPNLQP